MHVCETYALPSSLLVAVELNYGTVYCFRCRDYIYDAELDQISREVEQQLAHKQYHGEEGGRDSRVEGREKVEMEGE